MLRQHCKNSLARQSQSTEASRCAQQSDNRPALPPNSPALSDNSPARSPLRISSRAVLALALGLRVSLITFLAPSLSLLFIMSNKKGWGREDIFEQEDSEEHPAIEHEEGEVVSEEEEEEEEEEEGQIASQQHPEPQIEDNPERLYDSSVDDESHLQAEKRKRELRQRKREEEEEKMAGFSQEDILKKAMLDVERTNKRVMLMRRKNVKRMEDLEKVRMSQQPYLTSGNTHFRGSPNEYPLITTDRSGRSLYHPNYSLKMYEMKLGDFIQKNIREQSSANYLNEVVKFENYAYQQRKKRRQHIE